MEDHGALRIFLRDVLTQLGWERDRRRGHRRERGIVLKEGGLPELVAGIEAVTRGEQYLSPSLSGGN